MFSTGSLADGHGKYSTRFVNIEPGVSDKSWAQSEWTLSDSFMALKVWRRFSCRLQTVTLCRTIQPVVLRGGGRWTAAFNSAHAFRRFLHSTWGDRGGKLRTVLVLFFCVCPSWLRDALQVFEVLNFLHVNLKRLCWAKRSLQSLNLSSIRWHQQFHRELTILIVIYYLFSFHLCHLGIFFNGSKVNHQLIAVGQLHWTLSNNYM